MPLSIVLHERTSLPRNFMDDVMPDNYLVTHSHMNVQVKFSMSDVCLADTTHSESPCDDNEDTSHQASCEV
jgi:hypothetical protein